MKDYQKQRLSNLLAYIADDEMMAKRKVVEKLIQEMDNDISWALACSGCMYFNGAWDEMNDLDIIVSSEDVERFTKTFYKLGGELVEGQREKARYFDSGYYASGKLDEVEFDVISDYTVTTYGTRYCFSLKKEEIKYCKEIPLIPMEANFLLYGMMTGWQEKRFFKYGLCLEYLKNEGIFYPEILEQARKYNLPRFIAEDIESVI